MKRHYLIPLFSCLSLLVGCDDSSVDTSEVELNPSSRVVDLSDLELAALCDQTVDPLGGYGANPTCEDGPAIRVPSDQTTCVEDANRDNQDCEATVADYEACVAELADEPCLSVLINKDACLPLTACSIGQ